MGEGAATCESMVLGRKGANAGTMIHEDTCTGASGAICGRETNVGGWWYSCARLIER